MKKPSAKTLDKKSTDLASEAMRTIGYCESCGSNKSIAYSQLDCSHIISRTYKKVKYDPRNTQCLCKTCHGKYGGNPPLFTKFVESSSVGIYIDHMNEIAYDTRFKVDHEYWDIFNKRIIDGELTIFEARDLLGFSYVGLKF